MGKMVEFRPEFRKNVVHIIDKKPEVFKKRADTLLSDAERLLEDMYGSPPQTFPKPEWEFEEERQKIIDNPFTSQEGEAYAIMQKLRVLPGFGCLTEQQIAQRLDNRWHAFVGTLKDGIEANRNVFIGMRANIPLPSICAGNRATPDTTHEAVLELPEIGNMYLYPSGTIIDVLLRYWRTEIKQRHLADIAALKHIPEIEMLSANGSILLGHLEQHMHISSSPALLAVLLAHVPKTSPEPPDFRLIKSDTTYA
jgi:hypothetical protein